MEEGVWGERGRRECGKRGGGERVGRGGGGRVGRDGREREEEVGGKRGKLGVTTAKLIKPQIFKSDSCNLMCHINLINTCMTEYTVTSGGSS